MWALRMECTIVQSRGFGQVHPEVDHCVVGGVEAVNEGEN